MNLKKNILIAVASKDGGLINQHFGHAERFLIYKASKDHIELIEEREVNKYCLGEDTYDHPFEEERFNNVVNTIRDCKYILVSRIGTIPEKRLKEKGISSVITYDRIEDGIRKVLNRCR